MSGVSQLLSPRSIETSLITNIDLLGEDSLTFAILSPVIWLLRRSLSELKQRDNVTLINSG